VTVIELPASWGNPSSALAKVETELERGPATDLVLLPEASLTGYVSADGDFDLRRFAEPADGPTARAVSELARRRSVSLVAPLVLEEDGAAFNAMVAFDRHGMPIFTYRKRHPWFPETWARAGTEPAPFVDIDGTLVTIAICFDVHFLEEDAAVTLHAADLLLFPSAWVEQDDSRPEMLASLARRHRVSVANANWAPGLVRIPGQGGSCILDTAGTTLAKVATSSSSTPRVARADAVVELARTR
jgi:predicted amidohydrolase